VSKGDWTQVKDVAEFLNKQGVRRSGTHNLSKKILHWSYCVNCGIIALKNDVTRRALKASCIWYDD
jgi:hypothetical protein